MQDKPKNLDMHTSPNALPPKSQYPPSLPTHKTVGGDDELQQESLKWQRGSRKWLKTRMPASGTSGNQGSGCDKICQMTNVRIFFPRVLRIIVANPLDQIVPLSATTLLAQDRLNFIVCTAPVCVNRRW